LGVSKKESYLNFDGKDISNDYKMYVTKVVQALRPNIKIESIQKDIEEIYILEEEIEKVCF
jgi:hypothetical protein